MTEPTKEYTIDAVSLPLKNSGLLERILFPSGRNHAFLRLREDSGDGLTRTLAELHFTAKDKDGGYAPVRKKPMNTITSLMSFIGLETVFHQAVERVGFGDSIARLKGIQTGDRSPTEGLLHFGSIRGSQEHVLGAWNRVCAAAVEVNKASLPFTQVAPKDKGPANCNAGIKTILLAMGEEFKHMSDAFAHQGGRDLTRNVLAFSAKLPNTLEISGLSLESLQRAQAEISRSLHETSRTLAHPANRPKRAASSSLMRP